MLATNRHIAELPCGVVESLKAGPCCAVLNCQSRHSPRTPLLRPLSRRRTPVKAPLKEKQGGSPATAWPPAQQTRLLHHQACCCVAQDEFRSSTRGGEKLAEDRGQAQICAVNEGTVETAIKCSGPRSSWGRALEERRCQILQLALGDGQRRKSQVWAQA